MKHWKKCVVQLGPKRSLIPDPRRWNSLFALPIHSWCPAVSTPIAGAWVTLSPTDVIPVKSSTQCAEASKAFINSDKPCAISKAGHTSALLTKTAKSKSSRTDRQTKP